jgi:predicted DNA-binding protein (UPF0251 family)
MPDIVTSIMRLVRDRLRPDAKELARIEREVRLMHSGERHRISERPRGVIEFADVDARLRQRMSVREAASDLGVSRRTIYRILRRTRRPDRATETADA